MDFALNLTNRAMARETDWCGVVSGSKYDKFKECGFTPEKAKCIQAALIAESPISIECRVLEIKALGSHDMFIAEVLNVRADEQYINPKTGAFDMERAELLAYSHGEYFALGEFIGYFGWSVKKGKPAKKRPK